MEKKEQAKRKPTKTVIVMLSIGVSCLLLVVASLFLVWYNNKLVRIKVDESVYQYIATEKVVYGSGTSFKYDDQRVLAQNAQVYGESVNIPILFEEDTARLITTCNMSYMNPSTSTALERVNYFTELSCPSELTTFKKDDKHTQRKFGFLYNGGDLYIFLEPVTLTVGGTTRQLGAMSYVICTYRKTVEYYNSIDGSCTSIGTSENIVSVTAASGYTLDAGRDVLTLENGNQMLLYNDVDALDVMNMEKQ